MPNLCFERASALTQDYNLPPPTRQAISEGRRDRLRPHGRYLPSPQTRLSPTIARVNPQQLLALALHPSLILDDQGLASWRSTRRSMPWWDDSAVQDHSSTCVSVTPARASAG